MHDNMSFSNYFPPTIISIGCLGYLGLLAGVTVVSG